jgi:3',5'-cyclic AMP phosphodiesterase CpdA
MSSRGSAPTSDSPARVFADPRPGSTADTFQLDSDGLKPEEEEELQEVPRPWLVEPRMALAEVIGSQAADQIEQSGKIAFHAVGDTGDVHLSTARDQESVIDSMTNDLTAVAAAPAFLFHLGDVVYFFGERDKYYEQFFDPFRAYDRPIFAIPGNHDGMVIDRSHGEESTEPSLAGFLKNFCAKEPGTAEDSAGIKREAMDQPGVYYTLDAPFVSIIGLYTNVLEGPGIISPSGLSNAQAVEHIGTSQLEFLKSELKRLKPERDEGKRAVIIACHHPPASIDDTHGGSAFLTGDLDNAFREAELWPDAVLSGHAHLYERWHRTGGVNDDRDIPYVIAGSGGYGLGKPKHIDQYPVHWAGFELKEEADIIVDWGYLLLTVDATVEPHLLTIEFKRPAAPNEGRVIEVELT